MPSVPSVGGKHIRVIREIRVRTKSVFSAPSVGAKKHPCSSVKSVFETKSVFSVSSVGDKNIRVIRAIRVQKEINVLCVILTHIQV